MDAVGKDAQMKKKIEIDDIMKYGRFAVILRCILDKKKMTQRDLAKLTGMSPATITHYINGQSTPSQTNLDKIAKCLDISPKAFFDDVEYFTPYLNSTMEKFSLNLNNMLREKGMRQEDLARVIGISRQSVNYYLNGKQLPREDVMARISAVFEKPISAFFADSDEPIVSKQKIYVTAMPSDKTECIFAKYFECKLGGVCDLADGKCSYLSVLEEK